ncbi:ABC transporter permease [Desulfurococcus amylolyticus]|uniref:ABC transporter transmembrane protein n=1 Tax=Desulfurococcus amylolyticus DSM 16532 TaxID=768672 RepID=I3XQX7_DESAM|nr:ABC transporter permease subunit [Desulfurococcus amylolyticus]AFL66351.1 ABC transporter transmembrane protein [Desulfurococcus amylolyticus DSM 16532]
MKPFIYDFKRALFRKATMVALVLFLVAGLGLTYISAQQIIKGSLNLLYNGVVLFRLDTVSQKLEVVGGVYDNELNPANIELSLSLYIFIPGYSPGWKTIDLGKYQLTEETRLEIPVPGEIVETPGPGMRVVLRAVITRIRVGTLDISHLNELLPTTSLDNVNNTPVYGGCIFLGQRGSIISIDSHINGCMNIALARDKLYLIMGSPQLPVKPLQIYYNVSVAELTSLTSSTNVGIVNLTGMKYLDDISDVMRIYVFPIELGDVSGHQFLNVSWAVVTSNGEIRGGSGNIIVNIGGTARGVITNYIGSTGLSLFALLFPVVMLYLGYVLIAKPKSQGALEFILARPITRTDLYMTRYIAGILVALTAPLLFVTALYTGVYVVMGVLLSPQDMLLFYLGIAGSLVAFYTLCYYIAVEFKGTSYLALAITLYLFFLIGLQIVGMILAFTIGHASSIDEIIKTQYKLYYFSPLGFTNLVSALVQYNYWVLGEIILEVVKPEYIVVAFAAWTLIPFIAGLLRFKVKNLSS